MRKTVEPEFARAGPASGPPVADGAVQNGVLNRPIRGAAGGGACRGGGARFELRDRRRFHLPESQPDDGDQGAQETATKYRGLDERGRVHDSLLFRSSCIE
jgi:hypothetical protein